MRQLIIAICWFFPVLSFCQEESLKPTLIDNTDPTRWIYVSSSEQPGLRGGRYLFDQWRYATLTFKGDIVKEGLLVNYNLEDEELEISTTEGIKIVPAGFITSWKVQDRVFVSLHEIKDECLNGEKSYAEILSKNDNLILLKIQKVERRNPVYNEKLGIGDNNYRYVREDEIILLRQGKCLEISGSAGKREKSLTSFLNKQSISKLVKENDLNLKVEEDLVALVEQIAHSL